MHFLTTALTVAAFSSAAISIYPTPSADHAGEPAGSQTTASAANTACGSESLTAQMVTYRTELAVQQQLVQSGRALPVESGQRLTQLRRDIAHRAAQCARV